MIPALALALALGAPTVGEQVARALSSAPPGGPRASRATRPLLDAPYLASPLGEAAGKDPDPRFRLDAFDCMTLVETAVALGSASTLGDAAAALDDIRYAARPSYASRNHEVLSQWIPENVRKGWIADLTAALGGPSARRVEKEYTPASWEAVRTAGRAIPGLARGRLPLGTFGVSVVPAAEAPALARKIPDGTIVFVVRADARDRATRVTHAGVVVRGSAGEALVRHATRSRRARRVIEEPIERFVRRERQAFPRWPVEGLAFFSILDNSARVRAIRREDRAACEGRAARVPPRM